MLRRLFLTASVLFFACDGDSAKPPESAAPTADASKDEPAPAEAAPTAKPSIDMPAVDAALAKQAVDALQSAAEAQQPALAARALTELEKGRLPDPLIEGIDALVSAPPDQRAMLLAKSITTNIALLDEACGTDAAQLMQSLATMAPVARESAVWSECKLERHGVFEETERAGYDPMKAMLAHMAVVHLKKGGALSADERALLRMMMLKTEDA